MRPACSNLNSNSFECPPAQWRVGVRLAEGGRGFLSSRWRRPARARRRAWCKLSLFTCCSTYSAAADPPVCVIPAVPAYQQQLPFRAALPGLPRYQLADAPWHARARRRRGRQQSRLLKAKARHNSLLNSVLSLTSLSLISLSLTIMPLMLIILLAVLAILLILHITRHHELKILAHRVRLPLSQYL